MNYEYLNKMIQYIEEHLTEKIEYSELAKIVGVSEYSLQRIFMFLTNISLAEYIRKRRLSKALEELKKTDIKIIDLAIKYQYESSISFTRAFKNLFGITPSECKIKDKNYKLFPILKFNNNIAYKELSYEIKELDETIIYCKKIKATTHDDFLYFIRNLYKEIQNNGIYKKFNESGQYGITIIEENNYTYLVGCTIKYENTEKYIIPKGKYAIFNVGSRNQKDIDETEINIISQWIPSTNYEIDKTLYIERYSDDNCYIYVAIKDKQN